MLLKAALAWMFQRNYCNSLSVFIGLSNTCKLVIIFLGELHYKQFWFMLLNDYVNLSFASTYKKQHKWHDTCSHYQLYTLTSTCLVTLNFDFGCPAIWPYGYNVLLCSRLTYQTRMSRYIG